MTSYPWLQISKLVVLLVHTCLYRELIVGFYGLVGWPLIVDITIFRCSSTHSDPDHLYFLGSDYLRAPKNFNIYMPTSSDQKGWTSLVYSDQKENQKENCRQKQQTGARQSLTHLIQSSTKVNADIAIAWVKLCWVWCRLGSLVIW